MWWSLACSLCHDVQLSNVYHWFIMCLNGLSSVICIYCWDVPCFLVHHYVQSLASSAIFQCYRLKIDDLSYNSTHLRNCLLGPRCLNRTGSASDRRLAAAMSIFTGPSKLFRLANATGLSARSSFLRTSFFLCLLSSEKVISDWNLWVLRARGPWVSETN